jgi:putative SOS response-associated peptidase YedK
MCGRFSLRVPADQIAKHFQLEEVPNITERYNIAPSQMVATIYAKEATNRQFEWMRWGLIPSWAKDEKIGYKLINARSETVTEKPAFRSAFKSRRCLLMADGFYEWQKQGKKKQPYYFQMRDASVFAFAGLWESWNAPDGELVQSCTLLTTTANALVQPVHERMPVILSPESYEVWLNAQLKDSEELLPLLKPFSEDKMMAYPVSSVVNTPANDRRECIEKLAD